MDRSLNRFFVDTAEKEDARTSFERQSARLLRIEVNDGVWLKPGAAIAYRGDLWFKRLPGVNKSSQALVGFETAGGFEDVVGLGRDGNFTVGFGLTFRPGLAGFWLKVS